MDAIERVFREEYGRVVASLVRRFGDIEIAEEAASEALVVALQRWPQDVGINYVVPTVEWIPAEKCLAVRRRT